ncbi:MAG: (Fe-S)-binding protein [Gammaproteobacteria bacterium]|nr:(Fe-S)-binding protein [Gammaproteobacteria bacterium]
MTITNNPATLSLKIEDYIISEAGRCVMCGLCLPHCPTYTQTRNENESPRGRIAIARALAEKNLPVSETLFRHLDQCILCRACERACPSGVSYGHLMDKTRQLLHENGMNKSNKLMQKLTTEKKMMKTLGTGLWFYQQSGLHWLANKTGIGKINALLPEKLSIKKWQSFYPSLSPERGRVALFTGCIASITDQETLHSTIALLNLIGFSVNVPEQQGCCGALHLHNGDSQQAKEMAQNNIQVFAELDINTIITTATGCSTTLLDYSTLINSPSADTFSMQIKDINQFLSEIDWQQEIKFLPLEKNILIHEPCSQKNIKIPHGKIQQLLGQIPSININTLPEKMQCCGAGGDYMMKYPDMAAQLREPVIAYLQQHPTDILVTSNIGCAMHIRAGIQQAGLQTEILHPVTLLAKQLAETRDNPVAQAVS